MKTSGLSLRFLLNDKHFYQGKLKLKCIASVPLYNIQNEAIKIVKDYQYRHELLQYFSSSSASSSASESQGLLLLHVKWWKEIFFPIYICLLLLHCAWHECVQFNLNWIVPHNIEVYPSICIHTIIEQEKKWSQTKCSFQNHQIFFLGDETKIDFVPCFFHFSLSHLLSNEPNSYSESFFFFEFRFLVFLSTPCACVCVYLSLTCERQSNWVCWFHHHHHNH